MADLQLEVPLAQSTHSFSNTVSPAPAWSLVPQRHLLKLQFPSPHSSATEWQGICVFNKNSRWLLPSTDLGKNSPGRVAFKLEGTLESKGSLLKWRFFWCALKNAEIIHLGQAPGIFLFAVTANVFYCKWAEDFEKNWPNNKYIRTRATEAKWNHYCWKRLILQQS